MEQHNTPTHVFNFSNVRKEATDSPITKARATAYTQMLFEIAKYLRETQGIVLK